MFLLSLSVCLVSLAQRAEGVRLPELGHATSYQSISLVLQSLGLLHVEVSTVDPANIMVTNNTDHKEHVCADMLFNKT